MTDSYIPERGDVIWLDFQPQAGHEQGGRRPAVVLSPRAYNGKVGLALLVPVTKQAKGYPFEVKLPAGIGVTGVVPADHVKNLDWQARGAEFICTLPAQVVEDIIAKLAVLIA